MDVGYLVVVGAIALAVGLVIGYLAGLVRGGRRPSDEARRDLENAFEALASRTLQASSERLAVLATERLETERARSRAELDERRHAIEKLLGTMTTELTRLETHTGQLEKARVDAYRKVLEQLHGLADSTSTLRDRTTRLATALRGSEARGRWGEMALRNVAELAGMSEHCDFELQSRQADGARPDMVVRLPGDRRIAVDAKAPLSGFWESQEAAEAEEREKGKARHAEALRQHIRALAGRDYPGALGAAVDIVVLFLPSDALLAAALEKSPDLLTEALRQKVLLATPGTLFALLRTVSLYWQQESLAENAQEVASAAHTLYERAAVFAEELGKVGAGLEKAVKAYNSAVGSFERRLMPAGRRMKELRVLDETRRELAAPGSVEEGLRPGPAKEDGAR